MHPRSLNLGGWRSLAGHPRHHPIFRDQKEQEKTLVITFFYSIIWPSSAPRVMTFFYSIIWPDSSICPKKNWKKSHLGGLATALNLGPMWPECPLNPHHWSWCSAVKLPQLGISLIFLANPRLFLDQVPTCMANEISNEIWSQFLWLKHGHAQFLWSQWKISPISIDPCYQSLNGTIKPPPQPPKALFTSRPSRRKAPAAALRTRPVVKQIGG